MSAAALGPGGTGAGRVGQLPLGRRVIQFGAAAFWVMGLVVVRGQSGCAGSLDLSFDIGHGVDPDRAAPTSIEAVSVQPDGKVVIAGHFESFLGLTRWGLARFQPDGSLDQNTDNSLQVESHTRALQPDGKQLQVMQELDGENRCLVRVDLDGRLDSSFVAQLPRGFVPKVIALQPEGKVLVGGGIPPNAESSSARTVEKAVIRLNADGSVDSSFSANVSVGLWGEDRSVSPLVGVSDIVLDAEGNVYVGGLFTAVSGVRRTDLARLHPDGSVDLSFEPDVSICLNCDADATETVSAMAIGPDGKLVIAGYFTKINGISRRSVVRLHTANEGCAGVVAVREPVFYFSETNLEARIPVIRRGNNAAAISVSYATGSFLPDALNAVPGVDYLSQSNLLVLAPGQSRTTIFIPLLKDVVTEPNKNFYLRLDSPTDGVLGWPAQARITIVNDESLGKPGTFDATFRPQLKRQDSWNAVEGIAPEPDGRILIRGSFTSVDGVPCQGFAILTANGRRDPTWNTILDGRVTCFTFPAAPKRILLGGEFQTVNGTACRGLALIRADGSVDSSFGAQLNGVVTAIQALTNGMVFVAGAFDTVNGSGCGGLACLNASGALSSSFHVGPTNITDGSIRNIAVQADGKILVGGQFWHVQGKAVRHLARFRADGSVDAEFTAGFGDSSVCVYALGLDASSNILVGGFFEQIQGADLGPMVRLKPSGLLDREFTPGFHGIVQDMALQPDGKILVAGQMSSANRPFHNLARLNPDGSLDNTFDCPWATEGSTIQAISRQRDGDILIGGAFTELNSLPYRYLARLRGSPTDDLTDGGIPLSEGSMVALPPCPNGPVGRLQVWGKMGRLYKVEASADLKVWSTIGVGTHASGPLEFTDRESVPLLRRFYRASSQE
jgi:uncharacterized delta-60 repeat protein